MTQSDSEPAKLSGEAIRKCRWQQRDCRQIAAAFQIWSESLSRRNATWLVATVVVTVVTIVQMLLALGGDQTDLISGVLILLTAAALAGYFAFNRPVPLDEIRDATNQFVGLSDQFEHAASMGPKEPDERPEELMARFYETFARLLDQKNRIWQAAPLAPVGCFTATGERSDDPSQRGPSDQNPVKGFLRRIRSRLLRRSEADRRPPTPA